MRTKSQQKAMRQQKRRLPFSKQEKKRLGKDEAKMTQLPILHLKHAENFAVDARPVRCVARGLNRKATVESIVSKGQFHEIPLHQLHHARDA